MASFSDLPFELQTDIWTLVLPYQGGVHWVEFEGVPHPTHLVKKSLEWTHSLFGDKEPGDSENQIAQYDHPEYNDYCLKIGDSQGQSSMFFHYLYTSVPSVYGKSKGPQENELTQDVLDEIAATRRCRNLSTYSQVSTLLMTCQTSRVAALDYLRKMIPNGAWPLFRGAGPMYRPRTLSTWKQQYESIGMCPDNPDRLVPTMCGPMDLVVYRLHTSSGYPKDILKHAYYQMKSHYYADSFPSYDRIGIEWHPLWATLEGRKEICEAAVSTVVLFAAIGNLSTVTTQLYWLVDGIPRPQWDQYPSAIPAAFSRVMEKRKDYIHKYWQKDKAWKDRFRNNHNLHQEFEANGRRYYVVFVVSKWDSEYNLEESFRDPSLSWEGPFPGGQDLWPQALHRPAQVAYEIQQGGDINMWTDPHGSCILSWEPI